jgi:hypothetical protein
MRVVARRLQNDASSSSAECRQPPTPTLPVTCMHGGLDPTHKCGEGVEGRRSAVGRAHMVYHGGHSLSRIWRGLTLLLVGVIYRELRGSSYCRRCGTGRSRMMHGTRRNEGRCCVVNEMYDILNSDAPLRQ